ncbi:MAG: hypothetical protein ACP5I4_07655, partial [Oceanipulchritudo sp.]
AGPYGSRSVPSPGLNIDCYSLLIAARLKKAGPFSDRPLQYAFDRPCKRQPAFLFRIIPRRPV